jgi:hypothetical protein
VPPASAPSSAPGSSAPADFKQTLDAALAEAEARLKKSAVTIEELTEVGNLLRDSIVSLATAKDKAITKDLLAVYPVALERQLSSVVDALISLKPGLKAISAFSDGVTSAVAASRSKDLQVISKKLRQFLDAQALEAKKDLNDKRVAIAAAVKAGGPDAASVAAAVKPLLDEIRAKLDEAGMRELLGSKWLDTFDKNLLKAVETGSDDSWKTAILNTLGTAWRILPGLPLSLASWVNYAVFGSAASGSTEPEETDLASFASAIEAASKESDDAAVLLKDSATALDDAKNHGTRADIETMSKAHARAVVVVVVVVHLGKCAR